MIEVSFMMIMRDWVSEIVMWIEKASRPATKECSKESVIRKDLTVLQRGSGWISSTVLGISAFNKIASPSSRSMQTSIILLAQRMYAWNRRLALKPDGHDS